MEGIAFDEFRQGEKRNQMDLNGSRRNRIAGSRRGDQFAFALARD